MLVAPVEMMVREKVDAHAELLHAAELRCIRQLAMLQREAMVARGMFLQRLPIVSRTSSVVSSPLVWQCTARRDAMRAFQRLGQDAAARYRSPAARRCNSPASAAAPKSLDRAVDDDLHDAQPQRSVVALSARRRRRSPFRRLARNRRSGSDARGIIGGAVAFSIMSTTSGGSGLARSVAVVTPFAHAQARKIAQAAFVAGNHRAIEADDGRDRPCLPAPSSRRSAECRFRSGIVGLLTPGFSRPASSSAFVLTLRMWKLACIDADRTVLRHAVEIGARDALVVEIDRIEAPAGQRDGGSRVFLLRKPPDHIVDRTRAGPDLAAVQPCGRTSRNKRSARPRLRRHGCGPRRSPA